MIALRAPETGHDARLIPPKHGELNEMVRAICVLAAVACLTGCAEQKKSPSAESTATAKTASPASAPKKETAEDYYAKKCVVCHGKSGKGDGAGAAALDPKPRDLTDAEWQKGVKDEYLRKIILKGGAAVGKSTGMPGNPDLEGNDELLNGLVKVVRDFGKE